MRTDRQEFTRETKEAAWTRAHERCELCCQPLGQRRPEYHHRTPAALGGDNSLRNCVVLCPPCHRIITRTEDMPRITKAKRVERKRANLVPRKPSWGRQRGFGSRRSG